MTDKVVSLRGDPVMAPGEVSPSTVALAERILEMARSGEIQGLVAVMLHSDSAVSYDCTGAVTFSIVGKLTQVTNYLADKAGN